MNIIEALETRKSTRAFLDKPVAREKIVEILRAARRAPSGGNAQPWQVAVVDGGKKEELVRAMEAAFRRGGAGAMDYDYYPLEWHDPYKNRRIACGSQLYDALKIKRQDKARRQEQWMDNYRAFDAPVILFFFIDPVMQKGSFLDYGMFIQSVMLAALRQEWPPAPRLRWASIRALLKRRWDTIRRPFLSAAWPLAMKTQRRR
jgi:nitroreductase